MLLTNSNFKKSEWSGGTTTELFIYPPDSNYTARDFEIRISSATVDVDCSTFTPLPNFQRVLMILSGELEITHHDQYSKLLKQYECDYFSGAWNTTAKGRVVDFNLMTASHLKGDLKYLNLAKNSRYSLHKKKNEVVKAIYLHQGELKESNHVIKANQLFVLPVSEQEYIFEARKESHLIEIIVAQ